MERVLFVGDLHAGSHWAAWPDLPKGTRHKGSAYVTKCWESFVEQAPEVDLLVLNGDLIDGSQRKSQGTGLFTTSLGEQTEAAIELLRPLAKKAKAIVRTWCTPYHGGFHNNLAALDGELGVSETKQVFDLDIGGQLLNVAHHPGGGSVLYRGTGVDKEAVWMRVAAAEGLVNRPRWIVRAHRHFYMQQDDGTVTVVACPPWQLPTPYAIKQQNWRFRSRLGSVLMERDERGPGGYLFVPMLFDTPKPKVVKATSLRKRKA